MNTHCLLLVVCIASKYLSAQHAGDPYLPFGDKGTTITEFSTEFNPSVLQADQNGFIIAGGLLSRDEYFHSFVMIRYDRNGIIDSSFDQDGILKFLPDEFDDAYSLSDLKILEDGRIMFTGTIRSDYDEFVIVCRFNSDGTPDYTFAEKGFTILEPVENSVETYGTSLFIQPDKKILISGYAHKSAYYVFAERLHFNGTIDSSFCMNGILTLNPVGVDEFTIETTVLEHQDKLLYAGFIDGWDYLFLLRSNLDGTIDSTFGENGFSKIYLDYWSNKKLHVAHTLSDEIYVASASDYYGGSGFLFRFDKNGQPDLTFADSGLLYYDAYRFLNIAIQTNGKFLGCHPLTRFLADGTVDRSFGKIGVSQSSMEVTQILILPDGNILAGGGHYCGFHLQKFYGDEKYSPYHVGSSIYIYPNPVWDYLYVHFHDLSGDGTIKIYDIQGRLALQFKIQAGQFEYYISGIEKLEHGVYCAVAECSLGQSSAFFYKL